MTQSPIGTAAAARLEGIDFAGKTGTAQVVSHSAGATSLGTGDDRANAWFVGMAPRRNPDIVVAVLCGAWRLGRQGLRTLAAQVINAFVTKQRKRDGAISCEWMRRSPYKTRRPVPPAYRRPQRCQ